MMKIKRIVSLILIATLVLCSTNFVFAEDVGEQISEEASGSESNYEPVPLMMLGATPRPTDEIHQCGDDVYWTIEDNTLIFWGSGSMWDYNNDTHPYDARHWASPSYVTQYNAVEFEEGITHIGAWILNELKNIPCDVYLPDSVTSIGTDVFRKSNVTGIYCNNLTELTVKLAPSCSNLKTVHLGNVTTLTGNWCFSSSGSINNLVAENLEICGGPSASSGGYAFMNSRLVNVRLPKVTYLGYCAFADSTTLENAVLGQSLTGIELYAFTNMKQNSIIYVQTADDANLFMDTYRMTPTKTSLAILNGGYIDYDIDLTLGKLASPTQSGYIFKGWYESADFSGEPVTDAIPDASYKKYYAKWEENPEPDPPTPTPDPPAPTPVRPGEGDVTIYNDLKETFTSTPTTNGSYDNPISGEWKNINGQWQFVSNSYTIKNGIAWIVYKGVPCCFYFDKSGNMQVGWQKINDVWYYFDTDGAMLTNTITPDGYKVDADGKYIQE